MLLLLIFAELHSGPLSHSILPKASVSFHGDGVDVDVDVYVKRDMSTLNIPYVMVDTVH